MKAKMSKVSGLQLVKPRFEWDAKDKLTETEQFKADCEILFHGPLSDWKDKQCVGLIINWLGREATQILNSVEAEINSTEEVFEALERVFRPESNQTLVRFKFRKMQQRVGQTCNSYMSELRLELPECKYKNDIEELLKDQFIFGIENKEIQDHLLGEISETDNSVKALYEARKIELKLAHRKMLGIVNPTSLVSVDDIKRNSKGQYRDKCDYCGKNHKRGKQNCPAFRKKCDRCGGMNHFKTVCRSSEGSNFKLRKRSYRTNGRKCAYRCKVHEIEECHDNNSVEDLIDQVQSLFYHWMT